MRTAHTPIHFFPSPICLCSHNFCKVSLAQCTGSPKLLPSMVHHVISKQLLLSVHFFKRSERSMCELHGKKCRVFVGVNKRPFYESIFPRAVMKELRGLHVSNCFQNNQQVVCADLDKHCPTIPRWLPTQSALSCSFPRISRRSSERLEAVWSWAAGEAQICAEVTTLLRDGSFLQAFSGNQRVGEVLGQYFS